MPRRAKIVCTLGPATATAERVAALVEAGMDIARLNFSHGTHDDHARSYRLVRDASDASGRAVGVLADLQGPKIRLGRFAPGLSVGLAGRRRGGDHHRRRGGYPGTGCPPPTPRWPSDVAAGNRLLVDDGNIGLEVLRVAGNDVCCRVTEGGPVSDHKGLSVPGWRCPCRRCPRRTSRICGSRCRWGVDVVALSFVRSPDDAVQAREIMAGLGGRLPLIAKLERPEAVERLRELIDAFDGIMVARGDLGVELPLEQVPLVQSARCSWPGSGPSRSSWPPRCSSR